MAELRSKSGVSDCEVSALSKWMERLVLQDLLRLSIIHINPMQEIRESTGGEVKGMQVSKGLAKDRQDMLTEEQVGPISPALRPHSLHGSFSYTYQSYRLLFF